MVRPPGILLPLAVLAAVQSGDVSRRGPDTHPLRPELARLVMEVGRNRLIEARLTGGFSYGRWRPGDAAADVLGRRVLAAAFDVVDSGSPLTDPATQAALGSGWLKTGDVGSFDSDAFLTLKERSKDMIISRGSNIYPREVE